MNKLAVILIIAHKPILNDAEIASLKQCYLILSNYSIKLVCPEGMDISVYKTVNEKADIVFIDPKWQATYKMFNELKKSNYLLKKFIDYQYLLFYELDAWVFKDELAYWCNKNYDYNGAVWFDGWENASCESKMIGIGNGGFSLRKVSTSLLILKRINTIKIIRNFWYKSFFLRVIKFNYFILPFSKLLKIKNTIHLNDALFNVGINEDYFWTQIGAKVFSDFKLAPLDDAFKFSFEVNASLLFKKNNNQLPFGCHAWQRYEPDFWKKSIPFIIKT